MTSSRLPGKVLKEINHRSLLDYHMKRLLKCGYDVVIATTTNQTDDCICDFAVKHNIKFYRGSEHNVLSRFYEAALKFNFQIIVRVTSDCPLIDPDLIQVNVEKYIQLNNPDLYMSNALERTFARGFDFEVFSFDSLKEAFSNATDNSDLEHVTPFIWKNKSGKVKFYHIQQKLNNSRFRITVDTKEDFELMKVIIEKYRADELSYQKIEDILIQHPELAEINAHIGQKEL